MQLFKMIQPSALMVVAMLALINRSLVGMASFGEMAPIISLEAQ